MSKPAARSPASRGRRGLHHDRAHLGPLRPMAGPARRRQRLQVGREPRLAGPRARDRAPHPGLRQVGAPGRYLQSVRVHLRSRPGRLCLPRRQTVEAATENLPEPSSACRRGRHDAATAPASISAKWPVLPRPWEDPSRCSAALVPRDQLPSHEEASVAKPLINVLAHRAEPDDPAAPFAGSRDGCSGVMQMASHCLQN